MTVPVSAPIALLAALATATPAPVAAPQSLAPVVVDGLTMDTAARVEKVLRKVFEARPGAVADATARPVYEAARQNGLTCDVRLPECLAQVGVVHGVDVILLARLAADSLELTAVDVATAKPVRRAKGTLRAPVLEADISAVFEQLAAPAAATTSLAITAPSGASVDVDGTPHGIAPIAAVTGLPPGEHIARATLNGSTMEARVVVALGEATAVTLAPAAATESAAADGPARRQEAPSMTVPLVVGGTLGAVGGLAVLLGGMSWLDVVGARGELDTLQARADSGDAINEVFVGDTQLARDRFDAAKVTWEGQGIPLVALGLGAVGAGVAVIATTLVLGRE